MSEPIGRVVCDMPQPGDVPYWFVSWSEGVEPVWRASDGAGRTVHVLKSGVYRGHVQLGDGELLYPYVTPLPVGVRRLPSGDVVTVAHVAAVVTDGAHGTSICLMSGEIMRATASREDVIEAIYGGGE